MKYDPLYQPYASNRYCVTAANGMVATGNSLASAAGLSIMRKGGNAIDAAVATALIFFVCLFQALYSLTFSRNQKK